MMSDQTDVIGIDPGSQRTGYGVVSIAGNKFRCIEYGCIRLPSAKPLCDRLKFLSDKLEDILRRTNPGFMAVEGVFTAKNVSSAIKLAHVRGVVLLTGAKMDLDISEYAPATVKQAVTGYGRATKDQVIYMVQKILHLDEPPRPADSADALAIAICHLNTLKLKKKIGVSQYDRLS